MVRFTSRCMVVCVTLLAGLAPLAKGAFGEDLSDLHRLIEAGRWKKASQVIERQLGQAHLTFSTRQTLLFEQERMRRMRLDFSKTRHQVLAEARRLVPGLEGSLFAQWEEAGAVEFLEIDGRRCYFNRTAGNVFRVHPEARALKAKQRPREDSTPPHRLENLRRILAHAEATGESTNTPKKFRVTVKLIVKPDAVPAGEIIRAWLPRPHSDARQQVVGELVSEPAHRVLNLPGATLSAVYLEKRAVEHEPTTFGLAYEYVCHGVFRAVDPRRVRPVATNDPALAPWLAERPPHLVFDDDLRALSREIVGNESNPFLKARRIFQWVHEHIPWAGAREYSTLDSLTRYALRHRWGDCGIQTMLFMSLCRLNGIPARWVSGWTTGPDKNMHDWCEVYFEPYGWVPADVSYGLVDSSDERERWFFLGGLDSFRLAVNTDYGQPLYPAKTHFRSEIVDFQRGEIEWRGGNLYFDQWSCDLRAEEMPMTAPHTSGAREADPGGRKP